MVIVIAIIIITATVIYLIVVLCLYNAKCFLRVMGGDSDKKLQGRLLVLRSRQGFCKKE